MAAVVTAEPAAAIVPHVAAAVISVAEAVFVTFAPLAAVEAAVTVVLRAELVAADVTPVPLVVTSVWLVCVLVEQQKHSLYVPGL